MAEVYANNVSKIDDAIAKSQQEQIQSYDALADKVSATSQEKLRDYIAKWSGVESIGGSVGAALPIFRGGRKLYKQYQNLRSTVSKVNEGGSEMPSISQQADVLPTDLGSDMPGPVQTPDARAPDITGIKDIKPEQPTVGSSGAENPTMQEEDVYGIDDEKSLPQYQGTDTTGTTNTTTGGGDLDGQALKDAGFTEDDAAGLFEDAGTTATEEAGSSLASFFAADSIASTIPVVGEVAAGIGGLVAIGDGIAHLFDPPKNAPSPAPVSITLPTGLTSQYADSVPSIDGTTQRSASSSVF